MRGEINNDDDNDGDVGNTSVNTLNSLRSNSSKSSRISKKERRANMVSWKKRRRMAEAQERAENLQDMLSTKVEKSIDKNRGINERRKPWQEYNEKVIKPLLEGTTADKAQKPTNMFDLLGGGDDDEEGDNDDNDKAEGGEMDVSE